MTASRRLTSQALLGVVVAGIVTLIAGRADPASRYDPSLHFRRLVTPHFAVYFHQGEEQLARRLAVVAEQVHSDLTKRLITTSRRQTQVVLVDQDDRANGLSTVFPYDFVEIVAGPPGGSSLIGNTDDWLRLVFVHEYTHVLTLDRSESFAGGLRRVFGRAPFVFPNLYQPVWEIEGIATFAESAMTGRGRLAAGDFRAIVAEPARTGRFGSIDRASSDLVPWPDGHAPYAYGGHFYRYLADKYGEPQLARLAATTARGYFFLPGPAFSKVFGTPLHAAWREFANAFSGAATAPAENHDGVRRLTRQGFQVQSPRYLSGEIVYTLQDAHDFPSLMLTAADGSGGVRRLTDSYGGTRVAGHGRLLVFDQIEISRNVALRSDLYSLDLDTRRVRRLTSDARLVEPDVSPNGRLVACIRVVGGKRTLVVFELAALSVRGGGNAPEPLLVVDEVDAQFGSPRFSPDSRWLAAEHWRLGGQPEIIVVDVASGHVTLLARAEAGRLMTPAWFPDGRSIVFASDMAGAEFSLYAIDVRTDDDEPKPVVPNRGLYRVVQVPGGATSPDVSPDGRTIVFVGYTPDGYDLFTIPVTRDRWPPLAAGGISAMPGTSSITADSADLGATGASLGYSPFPTLLPRYWVPVLRTEDGYLKAGGATSGVDVLGRHAYNVDLAWRVSGGPVDKPRGLRPDWSLTYTYDRTRAAAVFSASDKGLCSPAPAPVNGRAQGPAAVRELDLSAGVRVPFDRVRRSQAFLAELAFERRSATTPLFRAVYERNALRLGWAFSTARLYGYSISPEQGVSVGLASEHVRRGLGADGDADAFTAEFRAYPRLGGRHAILSLRAGAGASSGDVKVRREFRLGGANADGSLADVGVDALSLLRGFDHTPSSGRHIAVANVDYRRPLFRLDRGLSWWPLMVRVVHGAAFVDAGNVWDRSFSINDTKVSAGGELSVDLVAGYVLPLTITLGGAWTRNGAATTGWGRAAYVRLGRAF